MDALAVVEAAYALGGAENDWLRGVVRAARPLFEARGGIGAFGFVIAPGAAPGSLQLHATAGEGIPSASYSNFGRMFKAGSHADVIRRIHANGPAGSLSQTLGPLFSCDQGVETVLRDEGMRDSQYVNAIDPGGTVCVLASASKQRTSLDADDIARWSMTAAHLAAAHRLRCRRGLERPAGDDERDEAVLDADGKVHDARGPARAPASRERLRAAALAAVRARGQLRRKDALEALSIWQALVAGRWSLIDRFDADGRRFLVARQNRPGAKPHSALSARELQVATLAAFGHSNKIIAYELGMALSSVSTLLQRAMRKLGLCHRTELVALFAGTLP